MDDRSASASGDKSHLSHYFSSQQLKFTSISRSPDFLPHSRQYSLSLSPSIIPAVGPLISALVSSGVSRYGDFRLLEQVGVYHPSGKIMRVPGNKEDIFKNKDISLLEKRRLMRFLLFAAGEFEGSSELTGQEQVPFYQFLQNVFAFNHEIAEVIVYSLAYCSSPSGNFTYQFSRT
jgi:Rab proteins geranylgeranyltransferase component A